jgi:hypothetical protein
MKNLGIATGVFALVVAMTSVASSETFTVTSDADSGVGSLREAITLANSNGEADEIVFASDYKIVVQSTLPEITSVIVITGNGWERSAIIGGKRLGDGSIFRIFSIAPTGKLILDSVMVKNEGLTPDASGVSNDGEFVFRNSRVEKTLSAYGGPGEVSFDRELQSVNENAGVATIGVTRWDGYDGEVSVEYATSDGTALDGIDYTGTSGVLTWSNFDYGTKTFDVGIINNGVTDGDRTVNLGLSNPTGGVTITNPSAVLVITDDDGGTGPCVQDLENGVVCLRAGRFELSGTWTDFSDPPVTLPLIWTPVEDINATAGFQNNPTGIQIVMRVADGCQLTGSWWVWLGGFTGAGWNIRVRDTVSGMQATYTKPPNGTEFPTTERDMETFICE